MENTLLIVTRQLISNRTKLFTDSALYIVFYGIAKEELVYYY